MRENSPASSSAVVAIVTVPSLASCRAFEEYIVAREEAFLERKFGAVCLGYKSCVRRWL